MKKIDSDVVGEYIKIYFWIFATFLLVGGTLIYMGFISAITFIIALLFSLFLPFPVMLLTDKLSMIFIFLFSGGGRTHTLNEQLAGDLEKVKILKRENKFTAALEIVEAILSCDPKHPEALFLKAQILSQEFEKYGAANACLNKIVDRDPAPDDKLLHWAENLREEILERIRERAEHEKVTHRPS